MAKEVFPGPSQKLAKIRESFADKSNDDLNVIIHSDHGDRDEQIAAKILLEERRQAADEEQAELMRAANSFAKTSMSVSEESVQISKRAEARTETIYTLMIWTLTVSVIAVGVAVLALLVNLR